MLKSVRAIFLVLAAVLLLTYSSVTCANRNAANKPAVVSEVTEPDLAIKEGYVSQKAETVSVLRNGRVVAKVTLGAPVMVAQADKEERWGFFQFPGIYRADDGTLIVCWQMSPDSHKYYGKGNCGRMMSRDEGKTWEPLDRDYYKQPSRTLQLRNGDVLHISTPTSKDINTYPAFPKPVCYDTPNKMSFYLEKDLPADLRGTYLGLRNEQTKQRSSIHGELDDPGLMRYAINNLMPLMWWGEMKELADGSILGGIYRCYYESAEKDAPKSAITFYRSTDEGNHWKAIGRIPYQIQEMRNDSRKYDNTRGFSEASFAILRDSSLFCVMRSGYNTPLYRAYSYDGGQQWTEPEAFTPNGVKPMLMQLDNGVMVLASGRPGVQLRFCLDGDGKVWTKPIEMLPFIDGKGEYDMWKVSCGYPKLLQVDGNTFYMVYSDFQTRNSLWQKRKAIYFRKVSITR